eukprot:TRINITY_DN2723_c0_g1_i1.p1 TRINITY_DN2723_c0_g1~~TRINITY_DN2723_c0_g1_i1.p1  ORF type:complete len:651 (+),score=171.40 TRINITY_DN2723_c0_g1_i1:46-1953(+)
MSVPTGQSRASMTSVDSFKSGASQALLKATSFAEKTQKLSQQFVIPAMVQGVLQKSKLVGTHRGAFADRYDVLRELGAGAGGVAMLVAPKGRPNDVLVAKKAHQDGDQRELLEEFKWMSNLRHPNIVKVIELVTGSIWKNDEYQSETLVVSEFAAGLDLYKFMRARLEARASVTEGWISKVFVQAMRGVAYLHSLNIIHNDLKPDNILMLEKFDPSDPDKVPTAAITDFGRAQKGASHLQLGDPRYQSPQKWRASYSDFCVQIEEDELQHIDDINHMNTDVWSMGITLFELLSGGKIAFLYRPMTLDAFMEVDAETGTNEAIETLARGVLGTADVDLSHCVGASADAQDLLRKMLCKSTADRKDAAEVCGHPWFQIEGHLLNAELTRHFQLTATKGIAHSIFLEAMTAKLKREHYDKAQKLFSEIDVDHNGHVTLPELEKAFKDLGRDVREAAKVFENVDTDKTRRLDFNEFMVATFDWQSIGERQIKEHVDVLFKSIDKDGNGEIDLNELTGLFDGILLRAQIEETFRIMDIDKDGGINIRELERFLFEPMTEADYAKYTRAMTEAPVELCEQIQPESFLAAGCCSLGCYAGVCTPLGAFACLTGCLAGLFRLSKTGRGHTFLQDLKPKATESI